MPVWRPISVPFVLVLCLLAAPASAPLAAPAAPPAGASGATLRWPDSEPARHARAWFTAFNEGEAAMRALYQDHYSPQALADRPIEERVARYREMRSNEGTLTPIEIPEVDDDRIQVVAHSGDGRRLTLDFECEAASPHRITGIRIMAGEGGAGPAGPGAVGPRRDGPGAAEPRASGPPLGDAEAALAMQEILTRAAQAD